MAILVSSGRSGFLTLCIAFALTTISLAVAEPYMGHANLLPLLFGVWMLHSKSKKTQQYPCALNIA